MGNELLKYHMIAEQENKLTLGRNSKVFDICVIQHLQVYKPKIKASGSIDIFKLLDFLK